MTTEEKHERESPSLKSDAVHVAQGLMIGSLDVVPGVSVGGTIAFILGIYNRLITAISHFDLELFSLIRQGEWSKAAERIDLRFLIGLAVGMGVGVLVFGSVLNQLFRNDDVRPWMMATLFGVIGATGVLLGKLVRSPAGVSTFYAWLLGIAGAIFAFWLCGQTGSQFVPSYGYLFVVGAIAICAAILPGISGSMMLLVFGVYVHVTDALHDIAHGDLRSDALYTVIVLSLGCGLGLILFSRSLKWLLTHCEWPTVACMTGFIFGSMRKLWPFQLDTTPEELNYKLKKFVELAPPLEGKTFGLLSLAVAAFVVTLAADVLIRHYFNPPDELADDSPAAEPAEASVAAEHETTPA